MGCIFQSGWEEVSKFEIPGHYHVDRMELTEVAVGNVSDDIFKMTAYGLPDVPLRPIRDVPFLAFGSSLFWGCLTAMAVSMSLLWWTRRLAGKPVHPLCHEFGSNGFVPVRWGASHGVTEGKNRVSAGFLLMALHVKGTVRDEEFSGPNARGRRKRVLRIGQACPMRGWSLCGFTLIELVTVLSILCLLVAFSATVRFNPLAKPLGVVLCSSNLK